MVRHLQAGSLLLLRCIRLQNAAIFLHHPDMTDAPAASRLSVGIVLLPDFTMLVLAAFVDTLRLAADSDDRSRPLLCRWTILTADGRPVSASNGLSVAADAGFVDPARFDYVAVVGGTLHRDHDPDAAYAYLRRADAAGVPLIGLCTGSLHLARAGLMDGRRACISWLHRAEMSAEFPDLDVADDALYVFDGPRITGAGGPSVVHLASELIERHIGPGTAAKGLRIMLEDRPRHGSSPQPPPLLPGMAEVRDPRVRRAMLAMDRSLPGSARTARVSAGVGLSPRQLNRLFEAELGCSMSRYLQKLRLHRAAAMMGDPANTLTEIAAACGFADAAHFSRVYRLWQGTSPSEARKRARLPDR